MNFAEVAQSFQEIERESSRLRMAELLTELLKKAGSEESSQIANLALGQLKPAYSGLVLNIAQKMALRALAQAVRLPAEELAHALHACGDLGLVAEKTVGGGQNVSLNDVYSGLLTLATFSGTGSQEQRITFLASLLGRLDHVSAKYVVRIVVGKLRLGFSDMTVLDALSYLLVGNKSARLAIEDAYNRCADIGLVAATARQEGGLEAIKAMSVIVGVPIRPASAERLPTAAAIMDKLGPCVVEPKVDGFRLQIHLAKNDKGNSEVRFFSRNLTAMADMFPDLTHQIESLDVTDLICEGEAIVYDRNTGDFLPFQETVRRKRKHDVATMAENFPLRLFLFDIIYLDGKELLALPLEERRLLLVQLLANQPADSALQLIEQESIARTEELERYFAQAVARGLEGVVVKRRDARYQPGKRNFNWIKLKRQSAGTLEDSIDCVILGYYPGYGKRSALGIGAFLVGVYNDHNDGFETIAKIGTGLSDEQWRELKGRLDALRVAEKPKNVVCAKELFPAVWTSPEIVCAVVADEITISPLHVAGRTDSRSGYALRFPRFEGYRPDKVATQATTTQEIMRLFADQRPQF